MRHTDQIIYTYPVIDQLITDMQNFAMDSASIEQLSVSPESAAKLGVRLTTEYLQSYGVGMDSEVALDADIVANVTTAANGTPRQFLQAFMSGVIRVITKIRVADRIAPVQTVGEWHQAEIWQSIIENIGTPLLYDDHAPVPVVSFNQTFERREIARFELGAVMPRLADLRAAATGINPQEERRVSIVEALEQLRNDVAFNGYDAGDGQIYGILNEPNLPDYVTAAEGASGDTTWSSKTVAERISDIVTGLSALTTQSGGRVDIRNDQLLVVMPLENLAYMSESDTSFYNGMTVSEWCAKNYPKMKFEFAPQFDAANSSANVMYMMGLTVTDSGTDGGQVLVQLVPAKEVALGTEQKIKGVLEDHTNALAGVLLKRPYAVVRYTGI